jgi:hypothetical protein
LITETAIAAKILSGYIDFFNEFSMRTELGELMPLDGVLGVYSPDLLGAVIIAVFAGKLLTFLFKRSIV